MYTFPSGGECVSFHPCGNSNTTSVEIHCKQINATRNIVKCVVDSADADEDGELVV